VQAGAYDGRSTPVVDRCGGPAAVRSVDEFWFWVHPHVWADGLRIFDGVGPVRLPLVASTAYRSGVLWLRYGSATPESTSAPELRLRYRHAARMDLRGKPLLADGGVSSADVPGPGDLVVLNLVLYGRTGRSADRPPLRI
jgi:hypothetical protein